MWFVFGAGAINTVFSLFYYIRILKAMYIKPRPMGAREVAIQLGDDPGLDRLQLPVRHERPQHSQTGEG